MAASAFIIPAPAKVLLQKAAFNLSTDALKIALFTSTAALAQSTAATALAQASWTGTSGLGRYADISANEVAGTGYTAGGAALTSVSLFYYVAAVAVAAGGSGYTAGAQTLTLTGGTAGTTATFSETTSGSAIAAPAVANCGNYSVLPAINAPGTAGYSTTGGGGTLGTLYLQWGSCLTCANPSWAASTITAKYAAIYDNTDANKTIIAWCDLETTQAAGVSTTNGTLTITIPAAAGASPGGIYTLL